MVTAKSILISVTRSTSAFCPICCFLLFAQASQRSALTITSKTHEQFPFTRWRSQRMSITLLFSLAYDFKPWKKSSVGSSNGIVINASTQWSFKRGLHVRTMWAFLAAVQMALKKKKKNERREKAFSANTKSKHTNCSDPLSPQSIFSSVGCLLSQKDQGFFPPMKLSCC